MTAALLVSATSLPAFADSLYGSCRRSDGSKVDGTARITTSWNGSYAVPRDGAYRLHLGGSVKQTITVYVDGSRHTTVFVDGDKRLDIVIR
jgi:hypothetical protein